MYNPPIRPGGSFGFIHVGAIHAASNLLQVSRPILPTRQKRGHCEWTLVVGSARKFWKCAAPIIIYLIGAGRLRAVLCKRLIHLLIILKKASEQLYSQAYRPKHQLDAPIMKNQSLVRDGG